MKQHLTLISLYPWLSASVRTMVTVYLIPTGPGVQVTMNAIVFLDLPETTVILTLMIVSLIHVFEVWSPCTEVALPVCPDVALPFGYQYVQLTQFKVYFFNLGTTWRKLVKFLIHKRGVEFNHSFLIRCTGKGRAPCLTIFGNDLNSRPGNLAVFRSEWNSTPVHFREALEET